MGFQKSRTVSLVVIIMTISYFLLTITYKRRVQIKLAISKGGHLVNVLQFCIN